MKIITVPNQNLRKKAEPITTVDQNLVDLVNGLEQTLTNKKHPQGVGLAFPQVDQPLRGFAFRKNEHKKPQVVINPRIVKHSPQQELGENDNQPDLEGCLSIPNVYGPVLRWSWIELEYQILKKEKLIDKKDKFVGFPARVIQHEIDHLDGILFTDYLLEQNSPIYMAEDDHLVEVQDRSIFNIY